MTLAKCVGGAITAVGIVAGTSWALASTSFDGRWSVQIVASSAQCQLVHAVPISVENGSIRYAGLFGAIANGTVGADGGVTVRVSHKSNVVHVRGSLTAVQGKGSWSAPTNDCTGTWVAHRT